VTANSLTDPDEPDARAYRRAMGAFATGVCVVTVDSPSGAVGMTVNSVTSVSLEPRLLLWCVDETSERASAFLQGKPFSVHVLSAGEADRADRFSRGDYRLSETRRSAPARARRCSRADWRGLTVCFTNRLPWATTRS